jgi:hypothetical protein
MTCNVLFLANPCRLLRQFQKIAPLHAGIVQELGVAIEFVCVRVVPGPEYQYIGSPKGHLSQKLGQHGFSALRIDRLDQ